MTRGTRLPRDDLNRFIFLLGSSDGEPLFDSERSRDA